MSEASTKSRQSQGGGISPGQEAGGYFPYPGVQGDYGAKVYLMDDWWCRLQSISASSLPFMPVVKSAGQEAYPHPLYSAFHCNRFLEKQMLCWEHGSVYSLPFWKNMATDRLTNQPTDDGRTDMRIHREVTLPKKIPHRLIYVRKLLQLTRQGLWDILHKYHTDSHKF